MVSTNVEAMKKKLKHLHLLRSNPFLFANFVENISGKRGFYNKVK